MWVLRYWRVAPHTLTHLIETLNHAALQTGDSFAVLPLSVVADSSPADPQIRYPTAFTSAPKPTRRMKIISSLPKLNIQL